MLAPKKENHGRGYFYNVTDAEIKQHLTRSPKDIFNWIESTNRFVNQIQTQQEREKSRLCKVI